MFLTANRDVDQLTEVQAASFPDNRFSLHRIAAVLRYWLVKNLAVRLGYGCERFRVSYWQTDSLQPVNLTASGLAIPGGTDPTASFDSFLGLKPFKSYEAHIIGAGINDGF